jgi:hypothetical protein
VQRTTLGIISAADARSWIPRSYLIRTQTDQQAKDANNNNNNNVTTTRGVSLEPLMVSVNRNSVGVEDLNVLVDPQQRQLAVEIAVDAMRNALSRIGNCSYKVELASGGREIPQIGGGGGEGPPFLLRGNNQTGNNGAQLVNSDNYAIPHGTTATSNIMGSLSSLGMSTGGGGGGSSNSSSTSTSSSATVVTRGRAAPPSWSYVLLYVVSIRGIKEISVRTINPSAWLWSDIPAEVRKYLIVQYVGSNMELRIGVLYATIIAYKKTLCHTSPVTHTVVGANVPTTLSSHASQQQQQQQQSGPVNRKRDYAVSDGSYEECNGPSNRTSWFTAPFSKKR